MENQRYFKVLDVETVKDFCDGFQGQIFPLYKETRGEIILTTPDGELIFFLNEVEEITN